MPAGVSVLIKIGSWVVCYAAISWYLILLQTATTNCKAIPIKLFICSSGIYQKNICMYFFNYNI